MTTRETERLVLRPWERDRDLEPFVALNADPEVMRHIGPFRPLSRAESTELLERIVRHWADHGFGLWAVEPRAEPAACAGFIGLAIPSFLPAVLPAVEVGWRLAPAWWGRGLATEGAHASVDYAFRTLALAQVIAIVDPDNERSLRVTAKLGMRAAPDRLHPISGRRLRVMVLDADTLRDDTTLGTTGFDAVGS